jgi:hypothetical protein
MAKPLFPLVGFAGYAKRVRGPRLAATRSQRLVTEIEKIPDGVVRLSTEVGRAVGERVTAIRRVREHLSE